MTDVSTSAGGASDAIWVPVWVSITAFAVDSVTPDVAGLGWLSASFAAGSLPGQGAPSATATLAQMIEYLYKEWRNKSEQTETEKKLYADNGTTVDQKSTVSDDGTTATKGEYGTGA